MKSHIMRFEKEILSKPILIIENADFDYSKIEGWRTVAPGDVLKDYYFQTEKSLKVFKGQVLEI